MSLLYACSSNPGKLREFTAQLTPAGLFAILPLPCLAELTPPNEDGATYQENAALKALYYSRFTEELVFADDSGLEVRALDGAPGIHSARFAGPSANGAQNNALLLARLAGTADRQARFVTAISLARQGKLLQTTLGTATGEILAEPRGSLGFGYDALFLFPPLGKTFAEVGDAEKFGVSARGEAFRRLLEWLTFNSDKIQVDAPVSTP
jgi:XTP/dITP diphosphohydrolase